MTENINALVTEEFAQRIEVGNLIGGTVIFTLLSYAQIRDELKGGDHGAKKEAR